MRSRKFKGNEEHLKLLKQGVEAWNRWRKEKPDIRPNLFGANLCRADLRAANLSAADLYGADLSGADLREADLSGANLREADLRGADLREAYLRGADLRGAHLSGADLSGANLSGAHLIRADLREADLIEADLSGAHLHGADLYGANLIEADLSKAYLIEANLIEAGLRGADLSGAHLHGADLSGAHLRGADLSGAHLIRADLRGADLEKATLVETDLEKATLTGCSIYGISAWDLNLKGAAQSGLIITPRDDPIIQVDDLEVAQFIYLLLNYEKLRSVFNAVTERGVLILGRFGDGGLELLQAIAAKLRESNYLPIIFEFDRPESRNLTETISTLAGLSRFVIADLSGPSVPQELYATVPHFKIPFVPIIEKGRKKFALFVDISEYPWVLPTVEFEDKAQLLELLPGEIIAPAEEKHQERQRLLDELFKADEG
jgi:uncharacterized protein YjbI with pentapeptide repeats